MEDVTDSTSFHQSHGLVCGNARKVGVAEMTIWIATSWRRSTLAAFLALLTTPVSLAWGQDANSLVAPHRHEAVEIEADPIISRMAVPLVKPRRVLIDDLGNVFVADWGGGAVLKVSREGEVSIVADGLNEPAGMALDPAGYLFVAQHALGMEKEGSVVRIAPSGEQMIFADHLTGPTDLAFDRYGNLYVANFDGNSIVKFDPAGQMTVFAENVPAPAALAIGEFGSVFAASSTEGTVIKFTTDGAPIVLARGLNLPSDLAFDPEGHLIVTNYGGTELSYLDPAQSIRTFAAVPKGTVGLDFDPEGNLVLSNWDLQLLIRITLNVTVPCPHCEKKIPVRLKPKAKEDRSDRKGPML